MRNIDDTSYEHRRMKDISSYWTPERVSKAIPRDMMVFKPSERRRRRRQQQELQIWDENYTMVPHRIDRPNQYLLRWGSTRYIECSIQHEALSQSEPLSFFRDNHHRRWAAPEGTVISPQDHALLRSEYVDLVVDLYDADGDDDLDVIMLFLDDYASVSHSIISPDLGNGRYTFSLGPLRDGEYRWSIVVKDLSGRMSDRVVNHFTIDTSKPDHRQPTQIPPGTTSRPPWNIIETPSSPSKNPPFVPSLPTKKPPNVNPSTTTEATVTAQPPAKSPPAKPEEVSYSYLSPG